jgi:Tol biopolymer transport system component
MMDLRSALNRTLAVSVLFSCGAAFSAAATANSPKDRQATDPKSIKSDSNPSARPIAIDDLFYSRRVTAPTWSPDGKQVAFSTNLTGRINLWKVSADGGWPLQLVVSDDRQYDAVWSPDGKWVVYDQDFGGSEYYDLFAVPSDGGAPINLTNTPDISESGAQFSSDGKTLAFGYKPKTSPVSDIALLDWSSHQVKKLTNEQTKDYSWQFDTWTRDGKYVIASHANAGFDDSSVYRIDVASGQAEELTPHQGKVLFFPGGVSPDGKTILVTPTKRADTRMSPCWMSPPSS